MTSKQLLSEITVLAGESDISEGLALTALNASLRAIYSELGFTSRGCITLEAIETAKRIPHLRYTPNEVLSITSEGVAFGLSAFGKGFVTVKDTAGQTTYRFDGDYVEIYGNISGTGSLTFGGEYGYSVRDLCFFKKLDRGVIPSISDRRKVKIDAFISDYSSALSGAENKNGMPIASVDLIGNELSLPSDFSGKVYFTYRKSPPRITKEHLTDELTLPSSALSAISALATAYVLKSMDRDGADFFFEEYERRARCIKSSERGSRSDNYLDFSGWA